ncbi:MAG: hypothetical protein IPP37_07075 [Saprospiraceae bacterium]|nr:hypothetical protein [Saprospiraceae bacterium]
MVKPDWDQSSAHPLLDCRYNLRPAVVTVLGVTVGSPVAGFINTTWVLAGVAGLR